MITLKYKIEYNTNPLYPHSVETSIASLLVNSEEEANEYLDLASKRGTILEVVLVWGISHTLSVHIVILLASILDSSDIVCYTSSIQN